MVLIKILLPIIYVQECLSFNISPDSPVPHADVLDKILNVGNFRNETETNSISVFDYLFGNNFTDIENTQVSENLDICLLSPENIKKIVVEAQRKYELTRSYNETLKENPRRHYDYIYYYREEYTKKAMDWMKQSIYGTRRRLQATRPYRKKYHKNLSYNIGILYGILNEMLLKVQSLFSEMRKIHYHFPYVWFVLTYQRVLAFNVDITYLVERMFDFQKKWNVLIKRKEKNASPESREITININDTLTNPHAGSELENWANQGGMPAGPDSVIIPMPEERPDIKVIPNPNPGPGPRPGTDPNRPNSGPDENWNPNDGPAPYGPGRH